MNEEGQDFERLRRVLALKRHETPPPRYFNELPGRITARIAASGPEAQETLWDRLRRLFSERPAFATGAGIAAGCAVLATVAALSLPPGRSTGTAEVQPSTPPANAIATAPTRPLESMAASNANSGAEFFQNRPQQAVPVSHRIEPR
jgi:hypothetical protein